jgi:hypothetical protein
MIIAKSSQSYFDIVIVSAFFTRAFVTSITIIVAIQGFFLAFQDSFDQDRICGGKHAI